MKAAEQSVVGREVRLVEGGKKEHGVRFALEEQKKSETKDREGVE